MAVHAAMVPRPKRNDALSVIERQPSGLHALLPVLIKAGYTGISVGKVDERYVMLPIHSIVDKGARKALGASPLTVNL